MPRQRRLDLPGVPQHVIQRGNNRQPCFLREQDYRGYLSQLGEAALACGCRIHAYVLMTNHVHLLMTPEVTGGAKGVRDIIRRIVVELGSGCENEAQVRTEYRPDTVKWNPLARRLVGS